MLYRISILTVTGAAPWPMLRHRRSPRRRTPHRRRLSRSPRTEVAQQLDAEFKALDTEQRRQALRSPEVQAAIVKRAAEAQPMLLQRQKDEFAKLDTNKDGRLILAEYQAGTTISARDNAADIRMDALDAKKDGAISAAEYRAATLSAVRQARQEQGRRDSRRRNAPQLADRLQSRGPYARCSPNKGWCRNTALPLLTDRACCSASPWTGRARHDHQPNASRRGRRTFRCG